MFLLDVMHVVRRHAFQPELLRPLDEVLVYLGLLGDPVVLEFEIKIIRAERLLEPIHRIARLGELILHDRLRDLARETARQRDQPILALRQDFFVNARLVVIALQMRRGCKFDEIFVADLIFREQNEMVVDVLAAGGRLLFEPRSGGDVNFAADDGLDALAPRFLPKIHRAVHRAVIRDGERGQLQFVRLLDEFVQTAGAIEQGILGVQMQMDKVSVRHGRSIYLRAATERKSATQQLLHQRHKFGGRIGLGHESVRFVRGTQVNAFIDCAADHEDYLLRMDQATIPDQIQPVHPVHRKVGDNQRRQRIGERKGPHRSKRIAKRLHAKSLRLENHRGEFEQHRLVVHRIDQRALIRGLVGLVFRRCAHDEVLGQLTPGHHPVASPQLR
jgi:hypothetical protein